MTYNRKVQHDPPPPQYQMVNVLDPVFHTIMNKNVMWTMQLLSRSCCTLRPQFWYAPELSNSGTYQNCWKEQFWYTASGRIVPTILVCSRIVGAILVRTKSVGRKQCTYFESCLHYIICPINKYKIDIGR